MKTFFRIVVLTLAFGAAPVGLARAQSAVDYSALTQRVQQVEKELRALQRTAAQGKLGADTGQPANGEANPNQSALLADMEVRISQLEKELRDLTGKIEEILHRQDQIEHDLALFRRDVDLRFEGGALNPEKKAAEPALNAGVQELPPAIAAARVVLPEGTVGEQYDFAFSLLRRGDYSAAEQAFQQFLSEHGDHELAGNAQYWLGESYYVRKDFPRAAAAFLTGFQKYGSGNKGPDSLLKLGMSLAAMNQTQQACSAFAELLSRYPEAAPTILNQTAIQRERLGCK